MESVNFYGNNIDRKNTQYGSLNVSNVQQKQQNLINYNSSNCPQDTFVKSCSVEDFYSDADYDYEINNIGATIKIKDNKDGTYTVKTLGSSSDSEVETKIIEAKDFKEKYSKIAEVNPNKKQTFFQKLKNSLHDPKTWEEIAIAMMHNDGIQQAQQQESTQALQMHNQMLQQQIMQQQMNAFH